MRTELSITHGAIAIKKDKLVADLKGVVVDADGLLKEVANSTTEEFAAARAKIEEKLGETIATLRAAKTQATRSVCGAADASCEYVKENPWKFVGIAAASVLMAMIISRYSAKFPPR
jgi:ElaB/YqjD/DUF883 family membrane-anchored ribosome-binding protein